MRTLGFFKGVVDQFSDEIAVFGNHPTMYAGLVDDHDNMQLYDGGLRFVDAAGETVVDRMAAEDYQQYIGEATVPRSFLKAPYFKPRGYPDGTYRVGTAGTAECRGAAAAPKRRIPNSPSTTRDSARWCKAPSTSITHA